MAGIGSIIAWHIGLVKDGTPTTGMVHNHTDNSNQDGKDTVDCYGLAGSLGGGPFWACENVGGKDVHIMGQTADGKDISPVHLSANSLFHLLDRDRKFFKGRPDMFDGPLWFDENEKQRNAIPNFPFHAKTWIHWDSELTVQLHSHPAYGTKRGIWHVWTELPDGGSDGGGPPHDGVPPDGGGVQEEQEREEEEEKKEEEKKKRTSVVTEGTPDNNGTPGETITTGGGGSGGTSGYIATPLQRAGGDTKAKGVPNHAVAGGSGVGAGAPNIKDYRAWKMGDNPQAVRDWMDRAPITAIQTAFYGYKDGNWKNPTYTQTPRSEGGNGKYKSGTADGGWWIRQPESDITTIRELSSGHPAWLATASDTVWGLAPNIKLFFGYPDLETGGIYSDATVKAWSQKVDTDNALKFEEHVSGTATTQLTFPHTGNDLFNFNKSLKTAQNVILKGGTNFTTTITSTPTADRVGTIQDSTGTFAWLTDIPAGAGVWTRTGTNLAPTTAGDTVGMTDSASAPMLRGVTDTNTGISVASDVLRVWNGGNESAQIDNSHDLTMTNRLAWKDNTAIKGVLAHANTTSDKTYTFPDESGQVKLKKDKVVFFASNQSATLSKHSVDDLPVGGGIGYLEFLCPNDFSSITSLVVVLVPKATDASIDIDLSSEYGSSTQNYATHTGSSTGTTYSMTVALLTEINLTGIFSNLAAGDYCGLRVINNDAATALSLIGVRMVYTSTD